ncbi:MAG: rhodanese-related sulfurtransferase [Bacteroidota bacterium]|nr:rhodanese-related sulfurtransferase [Bacteroidota bacterium]
MKNDNPYRILLFYKYVYIINHENYARLHLRFCRALGVKGRILIAQEGINGTLSGTPGQTDAYIHSMHMDQRFKDMDFKIDKVHEPAFKKLYVRPKNEIVTMDLEKDVDPNIITGEHLSPKEFYSAMLNEKVVILDARNDYEYDLGHFKNALRPDVRTFKEFPEWIKKNSDSLKDKKILTYCTGGVRCEKFTGLLLREGFENVYQLKGGIINYSHDKSTKGSMFEGKCYVFDERISVEVNFAEGYTLIGKCYLCNKPHDRYVNCAHLSCHFQFICCEDCEVKYKRSCSRECREAEDHEYRRAGDLKFD